MGRILIIPLMTLSALCLAGEPDFGEDLAFEIRLDGEQTETPKKRKRRPACLRNEPRVREVVKAAWEEAGLLPEEDHSRKSRVRASGWLPKLSGGVSKDMGDRWDYRYEPGTPRVDQLHQDDGLRWDVGLTWDLSKTVYQGEELSVAREASRRARERMDLAAEVIRLYFSRRRQMQNGLPDKGTVSAVVLQETTATLDAFTGERFRGRWCEVKP
jgi:hypothetical protein